MKNIGLDFSKTPYAPNMHQTPGTLDSDLEELLILITEWPTLPDAIRAGIMAMVETVRKKLPVKISPLILTSLHHRYHRVAYHNHFRPHQSLGNRPSAARDDPLPDIDEIDIKQVQCRTWLGGLLKHYYRQAA